MRKIRSIEDAEIAVRELSDYINYLRSSNIDLNQRRIKNAAPSIDEYDYVVRKELDQLRKEVKEVGVIKPTTDKYSVVFNLSNFYGGEESFMTAAYVAQRDSYLIQASFKAMIWYPETSYIVFDVYKDGGTSMTDNRKVSIYNYDGDVVWLDLTSWNPETFNFKKGDFFHIGISEMLDISLISIQFYFTVR